MKKISKKQYNWAKIGTIIGLHHTDENEPFVYGTKIDNTHVIEVSPIYNGKDLKLNMTGTKRDITLFNLTRHKNIPSMLFKKRRH